MSNPKIVIERPPGIAARIVHGTLRGTLRHALKAGARAPHFPWPFDLLEHVAALLPQRGTHSETVPLPHCDAVLVRAHNVTHLPKRVILYIHGGGFLFCGPNTHANIIARLSKYADCPVLAVDYRTLPKSRMDEAISDCLDAYLSLRKRYKPHQIVLAGDSAGGYLALATAIEVSVMHGETPALLALMSPLLQLNPEPKKRDPNIRSDAMFAGQAFDALASLIRRANGGALYEPLDWLPPGLPPTVIHVSRSEVLLHDAELAACRLSDRGVPVELRIWPGQIHVFQFAAGLLPEADRSLKQIAARIILAAREKEVEKDSLDVLTDRIRTVG